MTTTNGPTMPELCTSVSWARPRAACGRRRDARLYGAGGVRHGDRMSEGRWVFTPPYQAMIRLMTCAMYGRAAGPVTLAGLHYGRSLQCSVTTCRCAGRIQASNRPTPL